MYINGIKYACATCIKGHRSSHCNHVDRPLLEIRKKGRPVTQCAFCRDLRKTKQIHTKCACSDKKETTSTQQPVYYSLATDENKSSTLQDTQPTPSQVTRDPIASPLCPTAPPAIKEEDMSYSWALITSPPAPENNYLGFTFHKPPSQRFLDGQPRVRRRKSTKKTTNVVTPTNFIDPNPPSSNSSVSAAACEPMEMQFEYLTEQLELLSQDNTTYSPEEDLTAILNNVLSEEAPPPPPPSMNRSQCGSFVPNPTCCQPKTQGDSVIITITPLQQDSTTSTTTTTTTRIVTCYCGQSCTCPGCLVHPGSLFPGSDPYTGPSSSSSCYGSDEEYYHPNTIIL